MSRKSIYLFSLFVQFHSYSSHVLNSILTKKYMFKTSKHILLFKNFNEFSAIFTKLKQLFYSLFRFFAFVNIYFLFDSNVLPNPVYDASSRISSALEFLLSVQAAHPLRRGSDFWGTFMFYECQREHWF